MAISFHEVKSLVVNERNPLGNVHTFTVEDWCNEATHLRRVEIVDSMERSYHEMTITEMAQIAREKRWKEDEKRNWDCKLGRISSRGMELQSLVDPSFSIIVDLVDAGLYLHDEHPDILFICFHAPYRTKVWALCRPPFSPPVPPVPPTKWQKRKAKLKAVWDDFISIYKPE